MFVNEFKLSEMCEHVIRNEATSINGEFDNNVYKTILLCIDMLIFYSESMEDGTYYSLNHKIELSSDGLHVQALTLKVDDMIILSYTKSKGGREITLCNTNLMINDTTLIPFFNLGEKYQG